VLPLRGWIYSAAKRPTTVADHLQLEFEAEADVHLGSLGRPSTRSATVLRWISLVPP
jgi:hypothetical protein